MLPLKEELIGRYGVVRPILADLHFNDCITVRAKKRATALVPPDGRIAHIAVPSTFLGKDRIHALVALLIKGIKPVQICDAMHDHGVGVRKRFPDLTHPLFCDMRGTHDNAEGLSFAVSFLCSP